jgi:hypothetical protein
MTSNPKLQQALTLIEIPFGYYLIEIFKYWAWGGSNFYIKKPLTVIYIYIQSNTRRVFGVQSNTRPTLEKEAEIAIFRL